MNATEVFNFMRAGFTPQQITALESLFNSNSQSAFPAPAAPAPAAPAPAAPAPAAPAPAAPAPAADTALDEYRRAINQIFGIAEPELPPTIGKSGQEVLENLYKNMVGIGGDNNVNTPNPS